VKTVIGKNEAVTREPGFIYTLALMILRDLFFSPENAADINWHSHLNFQEITFLAGPVRIFNHRTASRFPLLNASAILGPMIPLPKPRGFWDYALFALVMTGLLMFLFWLEAINAVGWADTALAFATAVLFVFAIVLARRAENATWTAQPTRSVYLLAALGAFGMMFGAIYADAYLLHRRDITSSRFRHDAVSGVLLTAVTLWSSRKRPPVSTT
jgi:hypothetical protein